MKRIILMSVFGFLASNCTFSQSLGIGTTAPDPCAILELKAINKGFLPPRMTAGEKGLIPAPKTGLIIFQTDGAAGLYIFNGTAWTPTTASGSPGNYVDLVNDQSIAGKKNFSKDITVNGVTIGEGGQADLDNNTVIGANTFKNSTGGANTAIGNGSMFSNMAGTFNTSNGYQALYYNSNGKWNTANGAQSLYSNDTGYYNTASGYQALYSNIDGNTSTANGFGALYFNTTGIRNTASGYQAILNNVNGFNNTGMGTQSLFTNKGYNNTAIGSHALYQNESGNNNTAVGLNSLYSNVTGSYNTGVGYYADVAAPGLTYATAIGSRAEAACNNCMVLGSVNGVNGAIASTNVGIGVNAPQMRLHVNPNGPGSIYIGANKTTGGFTGLEMNISSQSNGLSSIQVVQSSGAGYGKLLLNPSGGSVIINSQGSSIFPLDINQSTSSQGLTVEGASSNGIDKWQMYSDAHFFFSINGDKKAFLSQANGSYNTLSDARLKTSIRPVASVLDKVKALRVKTYQYKNNETSERYSTGFLAQEVMLLFPEMVREFNTPQGMSSANAPYHGINYAGFGVIAIKAIQEQQQELILLQQQLDQLTSEPTKKLIAEQDLIINARQKLIDELDEKLKKLEDK